MGEDLRFENAIFCSSNCNFLKFPAHNVSLLGRVHYLSGGPGRVI